MAVTKDQADALAALAVAIRAEANSGRWDRPGIVAAIGHVRNRPLADVVIAVAKAADDPDLETPGAIGNPTTSCWDERKTGRVQLEHYDPATFCGICSLPEYRCRSNQHAGHEYVSAVEATRNARRTTTPDAPTCSGDNERTEA